MTTNGASSLDKRLAQLIEVTRSQGENITRLGQAQQERFEQEMAELRELKEITRQQSQTAERQQNNIERLTQSIERFATRIC